MWFKRVIFFFYFSFVTKYYHKFFTNKNLILFYSGLSVSDFYENFAHSGKRSRGIGSLLKAK